MKCNISIIIPVYNASNYLERLIKSIDSQQFRDFEVLLVNDGSTDSSLEVLQSLVINKPNYKIINQENAGAPAARNNGIEHAKGEYLYFCDADDELEEQCLSLLFDCAIKNKADLVIAGYKEINENTNSIKTFDVNSMNNFKLGKEYDLKNLFFIPPSPWNKLFKKELVMKYHLRFEDVKIGQDLYFYFNVLPKVTSVGFEGQSVYKYYVNAGSISNSYDERILNIIKTINLIKQQYKNWNVIKQYMDELQYVLNGHLITQIFKTPYIEDKKMRSQVRSQLIKELDLNQVTKNKYYKQRPVYFLVLLFFKYPILFTNPLTQIIFKRILPVYKKYVL